MYRKYTELTSRNHGFLAIELFGAPQTTVDPYSIDHVMAYYFTLIVLTENDYTSLNNYHMINKVNGHIAIAT